MYYREKIITTSAISLRGDHKEEKVITISGVPKFFLLYEDCYKRRLNDGKYSDKLEIIAFVALVKVLYIRRINAPRTILYVTRIKTPRTNWL